MFQNPQSSYRHSVAIKGVSCALAQQQPEHITQVS